MGHHLKRETEHDISVQLMAQGVQPIEGIHDFMFEWHEPKPKRGNDRDTDNITFAQKFIFDALVKCGIMADDGPDYVASLGHNVIRGAKDYKVIVEAHRV